MVNKAKNDEKKRFFRGRHTGRFGIQLQGAT
jgi:hypothetical protein